VHTCRLPNAVLRSGRRHDKVYTVTVDKVSEMLAMP
jgi:hypothetical protein